MQLTKFQSIALPLVDRGFPVTPVRPDAKAGAAGKWNLWQYTTHEQVMTKYVEKYADCNAGVVGMCGVGRLCFLDNDGGVPADVIARLPKTYTVATRPDSSHRHFYFTQTEYSVKKFGRNAKTINVRDTTQIVPSPSGGVMYRTLFDMKGIGGASLVVAAGSTKLNGDKYTCVDDAPVAEIPTWLADWVLTQQRDYERALNRIARESMKQKERAAKIPEDIRERLRRENHPDGFDVFPIDRPRFVRSQAFKFAWRGVTGDTLVNLLMAQVRRYVEGGVAYCESSRALESIRGIARHAEEKTREQRAAEMADFYKVEPVVNGLVIHYDEIPVPVRRDVMREVIRKFPDQLTCNEADQLLKDGLNLVGLEPYDKRRDKNSLSLIRGEEGFEISQTHWIRVSFPSPLTYRLRDGHVPQGSMVEGTLPRNTQIQEEMSYDNN